ncbi:hypothetical protein TYRP_015216 [Tyrophagus putrescentiae]|nr:hypothetical protein TYRP_015216 [Tyrophagus putrescentiae]
MTPLQRHQAMVAQMKASRKMNIGGGGGGIGADQAELLTVVPPPPAPFRRCRRHGGHAAQRRAHVLICGAFLFHFYIPNSKSAPRCGGLHLPALLLLLGLLCLSLPHAESRPPVALSAKDFESSHQLSSSSSAKRPTRITPSNSLPGSALIDLNSLNNNINSSVTDEESARREKARQMIKSMVSAQQQQQQQQLVVSPMSFAPHPATSPLSAVPINVPSMSSAYPQTATLPLGINLVANPLYSNQLAGSPTKQSLAAAAAFTNNSAVAAAAIYANLINNNHNNSHMINTTTTYPIPINHHHQLHHHLHQLHHHPHQNIAINHLYFNTQLQQQQQQQAYSNWAMIQQQQPSASFASSSAASASSPLYSSISTNFQDPIYMNEIFSKIQNNSNSNSSSAAASVQGSPARGVAVDPNSSSPPHLKSVLTPTSVFDIRKYTTSQSVIDLFDPLAEVESTTDGQTPSPEFARAARTSSPIPPPPEKSDAIKNRCLGEAVVPAISVEEDSSEEEDLVVKKEDDVNNNNNSRSDRGEAVGDGSTSPTTTTSSSKRHSYTNVNDEPINLLYVEERSAKYSPEMQEFCDHLRALYLTVGSAKSTNGASSSPEAPNSGLVWSPRIDMSRAGG